MVLTEIPTETVDTLEDLRKVEDLMKNDQLVKTYLDKTKIDTDLFK